MAGLILAITSIIAMTCFHYLIFRESIIAVSNQLSTYEKADYQIAYKLNYCAGLKNQFIYPDADIQLYLDEAKENRMSISGLMVDEYSNYTLSEFSALSSLKTDDIAITKAVAAQYRLSVGDKVYADFPYSSEIKELTIVMIMPTDYDIMNPRIGNKVCMVYFGYNPQYVFSTKCKYMVFSDNSLAEELSELPQIIDAVVNKSENYDSVMTQGIHVLLFEAVFFIAGMFSAHNWFFVSSIPQLRRFYLKGEKKAVLWFVPMAERLIALVFPYILTSMILSFGIPVDNLFSRIYIGMPVLLSVIYSLLPCIKRN